VAVATAFLSITQKSLICIAIAKNRYRRLLPLLPISRMGYGQKAAAAATAL
jgi:hypothetical protein